MKFLLCFLILLSTSPGLFAQDQYDEDLLSHEIDDGHIYSYVPTLELEEEYVPPAQESSNSEEIEWTFPEDNETSEF